MNLQQHQDGEEAIGTHGYPGSETTFHSTAEI
jgi:hypothetical protein